LIVEENILATPLNHSRNVLKQLSARPVFAALYPIKYSHPISGSDPYPEVFDEFFGIVRRKDGELHQPWLKFRLQEGVALPKDIVMEIRACPEADRIWIEVESSMRVCQVIPVSAHLD
jgi:hypothetical protein